MFENTRQKNNPDSAFTRINYGQCTNYCTWLYLTSQWLWSSNMAKHGHSSMAIKLQRGSLLRENRKWCDDFRLKVWTHSAWCSNGSNSFDLRNVLADTFTPVVLNAFPYLCFHGSIGELNSISVTYNFTANGDWRKQRNYDGENVSYDSYSSTCTLIYPML